MNPFDELLAKVSAATDSLQAAGELPQSSERQRIQVEPPREVGFGEAATNAALLMAKPAGLPPMALAERLAEQLRLDPMVMEATPARPGFINLRMQPAFWLAQLPIIIASGTRYGDCDQGAGRRVNVEFCSANPTGPLHVGHGRGTVFGDALANLLARAGYAVIREYYVNDGGAQVEALARSINHRYLEALDLAPGPMASGLYPLREIVPIAQLIAQQDGRKWVSAPERLWLDHFGQLGVQAMMERIEADLAALGVHHDVFTSERALIENGRIEAALAQLDAAGLIYEGVLPAPKGKPVEDWEPVPQLLFRASAFGDEIDRPLKRSNGAWTYFAADLSYHLDKVLRHFDELVDVWGADHGGYVKRMQAGVHALSGGAVALDVKLCQLVNLLDGGQPVRMSKRAGRLVTLRDVVDDVGAGAFRFMMLTRRNDAALDFDLAKVKEQSKDNPVFYVQYAHARICSVFRHAAEQGFAIEHQSLQSAQLHRLSDPDELALVRRLALYPKIVAAAAEHHEPHRIAFYLYELAAELHGLWTKGRDQVNLRFLIPAELEVTRARLAMLESVRIVIAAGLSIIGVEPATEMH